MQEFESSGSDKGESLDLKTFLSLVGPSSGAASQSLASERIVYFIRLLQVCVCMCACVCVCVCVHTCVCVCVCKVMLLKFSLRQEQPVLFGSSSRDVFC